MLVRVAVVLATAAVAGFVGYQMGRNAERPSTEALTRIDALSNTIEQERVRGLDLLKLYIRALEANRDSKEAEQVNEAAREALDRADLTEQELIAQIGAVDDAPRWRHREHAALTRMKHAHMIQENELQARITMLLNEQLLELVAETQEALAKARRGGGK